MYLWYNILDSPEDKFKEFDRKQKYYIILEHKNIRYSKKNIKDSKLKIEGFIKFNETITAKINKI